MNAPAEARAAEFDQVQDEGAPAARDVNLEVILDVAVTLSMEVGRTRVPIRSLLKLNQGSVVELDRAAGEPLDVFVNGTLIGGEDLTKAALEDGSFKASLGTPPVEAAAQAN